MTGDERSRLFAAATRALEATGEDPMRAIGRFQEIIDTDRNLRRELALDFLRQRAAEMRRTVEETSDEVQRPRGEQSIHRISGLVAHLVPSGARTALGGDDSQRWRGAARAPNPPRALNARLVVAKQVAATVLDTFKVRDGRAIGDLQWNELSTLARSNEHEARVLRFIADHVPDAPSHAKVRDLVNVSVLEAAIKHAEAVNAAA